LTAGSCETSNGSHGYAFDATGRLSSTTTGATNTSPTMRYAHDSLGRRVFKTEPLYAGAQLANGSPALAAFFAKGWTPSSVPAEMLGFAYVYGEDGRLLGEYGAGGAKSSGTRQYVWLDTPAGPMPVAMVKDSVAYAVTADHLNTPRRVAAADGALLWQWPYSAFGDEQPNVAVRRFAKTTAVEGDFEFNLRYPGQYFDRESNLHYNGFRTYNPATGRYTQGDPIGLEGGWNRFGYVNANALSNIDPLGLYTEVVIWRGVGIGSSSFGHVSTNINGQNFSWGPGGWDSKSATATEYNSRQQEFRGGTGVMLNLSQKQETALASCMKERTAPYNAVSNNCGNPVQQCLDAVGAGIGDSVLPSSILQNLRSSPNASGSVSYPSPRPGSDFGNGLLWR
jgi:RHS repeat-associated protein